MVFDQKILEKCTLSDSYCDKDSTEKESNFK